MGSSMAARAPRVRREDTQVRADGCLVIPALGETLGAAKHALLFDRDANRHAV